MKRKLFAERGQALVLITLAAVGLFAVAGLAIDGSAKYSDRRHAQNAADTAALAGALAKVNPQPGQSAWNIVALDRAGDNGYDNSHAKNGTPSNDVYVYSPPSSGIYANCSDVHFDCHDYVQVIINSNVNTFFARVIGIDQTHNGVEAVASAISGYPNGFNFGGNAIVALSPTGCGIKAGGNTDATINGGGLFSNSDSSCSFQKTTCAGLIDVNNADGSQGAVSTVGGYTLNGNCMPSADMDPFNTQISFPPPYQELAQPAVCTDAYASYPNTKIATLSPGHYATMPPKASMTDVTLEPGIYCIDSTIRTNAGDTLQVDGTFHSTAGVLLYLMPGGSFTFNGSSTVHLWGINAANDASISSYAGFLLYAAPDYASGTPATCTINGSSVDQIAGTIYAPFCNLKLNGGSGTVIESQVIAYTVDLTGASGVTLTYPSAGNEVLWDYPSQVGLTK